MRTSSFASAASFARFGIQCFGTRLGALARFATLGAFAASVALAAPPPVGVPSTIGYNPVVKIVQGFTAPNETFLLSITGPTAASAANPIQVELGFTVLAKPAAVDNATALSFISASTTTLLFDSPAEVVETFITVDVPAGTQAGDFQWNVKPLSWPASANVGIDTGSTINATVVADNQGPTPPAVSISSPTDTQTFSIVPTPTAFPVHVPFQFTATSSGSTPSPITLVTAQLDGVPLILSTILGLNTTSVSGSTTLLVMSPGTHTVTVTATNLGGSTTTTHTFNVVLLTAEPTVSINSPSAGQVFEHIVGTPNPNIPFSFTTNTTPGFTVNFVSATLDGAPVSITGSPGLGTSATVVSTGTLTNVGPGTHTLVATGFSGGVAATASVTFSVVDVQPVVPPGVTIDTPATGASFTLPASGSLNVPLSFTGTSNFSGGVITELTATLNGTPVPVTSTTLGQPVANGAATLTVNTAGTHAIVVTAKDVGGTATATRTFQVTVANEPQKVCGEVFFDVDANGTQQPAEFGLFGVMVKLLNSSNQIVKITFTDLCGNYTFKDVEPGAYSVYARSFTCLEATTPNPRAITVAGGKVTVPGIGFGLDFAELRKMKADGNSHGFWKSNIDKALDGKTKGVQISKGKLQDYTERISDFALSPYDDISMKRALAILESNSSKPADLLSKQLIAAEYNYQNKAYLDGNATATMLFIWWGEYVLKNSSSFSSSSILFVKDWFDAYNNSHGGRVDGPLP